jgi:putative protein kinase ArgK-like GTPase of G3E family
MADEKPSLAERLLAGDKRALARGISLVEDDDPEGWALVREIYPHTGSAAVVGFTGPPGAGKSTLIGALVAQRRKADREVAVLSIDAAARCWAIASGSPSTSSTPASSSARWRPAARSAGSPRRRCRRRC